MKDVDPVSKAKVAVYVLQCKQCNKICRGHTSMTIDKRLYYHKNTSKDCVKRKTSLSLQEMQWDTVKILHREKHRFKREILEGIYMYKNKDVIMNKKNEIGDVGIVYSGILDVIK